MNSFYPEGEIISNSDISEFLASEDGLAEACSRNITLEAKALLCTSSHDLIVELPCGRGIIKREEGALGIREGTTRDIALLSKVGKPVCFKVIGIEKEGSETVYQLSRRAAQQECYDSYISRLRSGDVIPAKVTHLERFGCFVDIGCGIPSLIPIDAISVSRISHPNDRFYNGQRILTVVKGRDNDRILLSHKELLGTWYENASRLEVGQTVGGIVRSIEEYGIFIELAPNLAGLAEKRDNVRVNQGASVFIKAIIPDKMKVKLIIVDVYDCASFPSKINYFINSGHISSWVYSTPNSPKVISTYFE